MSSISAPDRRVLVIGTAIAACAVAGACFVTYEARYGSSLGMAAALRAENATSTESHMAIGTVERISAQKITVKNFQKIPTGFPSESTRMIVAVNPATGITRIAQKSAATKSGSSSREKTVLSSIQVGALIMVYTDENISRLNTFTAMRIDILRDAPKLPTATSRTPQL